jgi:murein DD-endopeptidase MepM/ murein hydrolase activator NlpD
MEDLKKIIDMVNLTITIMILEEVKKQVIDLSAINSSDYFTLIKQMQRHLYYAGYLHSLSDVDGIVGEKTLAALSRFKKDNDLGYPYLLGETTADELLKHKERSQFVMPTSGIGWISSRFGMRTLNNRRRMHNGVDIACNEGTQVYSAVNGQITQMVSGCLVGQMQCGGGWGNFVKVRQDGAPHEFIYAHLDKLAYGLNVGDNVRKRQLLGFVGNTGHSFGNHLHFEIRKNGQPVDPLRLMRVV